MTTSKYRAARGFMGVLAVTLLLGILLQRGDQPYPATAVLAATDSTVQYFQASDGMGQYGYAMQQSTSPSQTLQGLANWNAYIGSRSQWGLTQSLLERLAGADWNARQKGSPTITPQQLADAANQLINSKLATMTAQQQSDGIERYLVEVTPKGAIGLNTLVPHVSVVRGSDGRWTVTVAAEAFSAQKAHFAALAPGMMSSGSNFYPGEAMVVLYSLASGDRGLGGEYEAIAKKWLGKLSGLDMSNRQLYGENGYLPRRPLNTFLTEAAMSQFYWQLGF